MHLDLFQYFETNSYKKTNKGDKFKEYIHALSSSEEKKAENISVYHMDR